MKRFCVILLCMFTPFTSFASECALHLNEGLAYILSQEGSLESVLCERNVDADLEIEVIFLCSGGVESPLISSVDRIQGDSWCGVQWIDCLGNVDGYLTPEPVSGKNAAEDFAAIRNACSDLF